MVVNTTGRASLSLLERECDDPLPPACLSERPRAVLPFASLLTSRTSWLDDACVGPAGTTSTRDDSAEEEILDFVAVGRPWGGELTGQRPLKRKNGVGLVCLLLDLHYLQYCEMLCKS